MSFFLLQLAQLRLAIFPLDFVCPCIANLMQ
jgi:hypothetical protein